MEKTLLLGVVSLTLSASAFAQEAISRTERSQLQPEMEVQVEPTKFRRDDFMTGDWGGWRTQLHQSGVDIFGFYNAIVSGNIRGGFAPDHFTYDHDIWLGARFDLEKLVGWKGALIGISGINRYGEDLTARYIGSIYSTQQLVGGQRTFLYQVYLQQRFNEQFMIKLGRFSASDDFNSSPFYGYSLNNGINGDIRNVLFDTRFSAYPFPVWAAALFYDPTPEFNLKFGVFQTSREMFDNNRHGLDWSIRGDDGYTAIAQFGWAPHFWKGSVSIPNDGKGSVAKTVEGLPGHYHFGLTFSQWDYYRRFEGGFADHSYGFYAHADQMFYQESPGSDQGLYAFLATGYYPQTAISIVPFQVNAGLNYKGLFPGRDDDRTMLHFIYGDISRAYARSVHLPGRAYADSEKVVEVAHRFQITPWSYFEPDLQWVIDPGGTGDIPNAIVAGAQMGVTF